jgi:NB-ARC domain
MASRKASAEGRALIKQRRMELGWNYCDPKFAITFGQIIRPELDWESIGLVDPYREVSECSIRRFQGGRPIIVRNFNILCQALDLDANLIADDASRQVSTTVANTDDLAIVDLIDMPKDDFFCGRENELKEISQWLGNMSIPFLNIWGAAGIGKSSLMAHWVKQQNIFLNVIWKSVDCENSDISCKDFVEDLLGELMPEKGRSKNCFQDFNKLLSQRRILIVVDGNFNDEYRQWFKALEKQRHPSCIVIISEPNLEVVLSNKNTPKARQLMGLDIMGVESFWNYYTQDIISLTTCKNSLEILKDRYDGNPTLLNLVVESIKKNFVGNLRKAMEETAVIPEWFKGSFLDKPFNSLSHEEQQILVAMAWSENEASLEDLKFLTQQHCPIIYLDTLRRSSIIMVKPINDEPRYSISMLWRKYLQRRFPRNSQNL